MRFGAAPTPGLPREAGTFLACLQTVLELEPERLPELSADEDPASGWTISRWLGGLGLGIARIADPATFSWAGPWIARVRPPGSDQSRFVVMYGVPSGVVWDPAGENEVEIDGASLQEGYLIAASDIAVDLPPRPSVPTRAGAVEGIWVSPGAGAPGRRRAAAVAPPGGGGAGARAAEPERARWTRIGGRPTRDRDRHVSLRTARERADRSEEHTSELQSRQYLVCR